MSDTTTMSEMLQPCQRHNNHARDETTAMSERHDNHSRDVMTMSVMY